MPSAPAPPPVACRTPALPVDLRVRARHDDAEFVLGSRAAAPSRATARSFESPGPKMSAAASNRGIASPSPPRNGPADGDCARVRSSGAICQYQPEKGRSKCGSAGRAVKPQRTVVQRSRDRQSVAADRRRESIEPSLDPLGRTATAATLPAMIRIGSAPSAATSVSRAVSERAPRLSLGLRGQRLSGLRMRRVIVDHVAQAAPGLDEICAEFLAQPVHQDLDDVRILVEALVVDVLGQFRLRDDGAGPMQR